MAFTLTPTLSRRGPVEVQDADGAVLDGLSLADCGEIIGDETDGVVR